MLLIQSKLYKKQQILPKVLMNPPGLCVLLKRHLKQQMLYQAPKLQEILLDLQVHLGVQAPGLMHSQQWQQLEPAMSGTGVVEQTSWGISVGKEIDARKDIQSLNAQTADIVSESTENFEAATEDLETITEEVEETTPEKDIPTETKEEPETKEQEDDKKD